MFEYDCEGQGKYPSRSQEHLETFLLLFFPRIMKVTKKVNLKAKTYIRSTLIESYI